MLRTAEASQDGPEYWLQQEAYHNDEDDGRNVFHNLDLDSFSLSFPPFGAGGGHIFLPCESVRRKTKASRMRRIRS